MAQRSNEERILNIATALEELNDEVVYVGGSVAQYYSKNALHINFRQHLTLIA